MSELPAGWVRSPLKSFAEVQLGKMLDKFKNKGEPTPYLGNINVRWGRFDLADLSLMRMTTEDRSSFAIRNGDLLVCEGGEPGRAAVWRNGPSAIGFQKAVMRVRPAAGVEPDLVQRYLQLASFSGGLERHFTGTTIKHLPQNVLRSLPMPVPPSAEQRRIVAKLDALTARTARARVELDRIPALAARYKQAVLAAAFTGQLTAQWQSVQSASGVTDYAALELEDRERGIWSFDHLPDGWGWKSFDEVLDDVTDSRRKLPTKDYRAQGEFPIVDQGEVFIAGFTDREDMLHPSGPPYVVFGDHTRCVKLIESRFVQGADGVKVLKPSNCMNAEFAAFMIGALDLPDKGYSRHMKFLRASYFPVCSLTEQEEVVRRVKVAFAEIDRLAAEAAAARRLIDRLDQAILAKAFRGELVPQDPADEPASVLLDRIRAERAAAPKPRRGRRAA